MDRDARPSANPCILGIRESERRQPQTVMADLVLELDIRTAAAVRDVGLLPLDYKP